MTEWAVVGVIVVLIGLMTAIITPIIKLNTSITRLTAAVESLKDNIDKQERENKECHDKFDRKIGEHDATLHDHETRLTVIERKEPARGGARP